MNRRFKSLVCATICAFMAQVAVAQSYYSINYDESTPHKRGTERYAKSLILRGQDGSTQQIAINQLEENRLYIKRLDKAFQAKRGDNVTITCDAVMDWMYGYIYLDYGQDGQFDVAWTADGVGAAGDMVTHSGYKGKNSVGGIVKGEPSINPPTFNIPSNAKPGFYRLRYKIDYDNVDPGGNTGDAKGGNLITDNGGVIFDTRINVHNDKVALQYKPSTGGSVTLTDGSSIDGKEATFGKALTLKITPNKGYHLASLIIRHGHNIDGEQELYGNQQWEDADVPTFSIVNGAYTIPEEIVDGDMKIMPTFVKDGEASTTTDYALTFDKDTERDNPTSNYITLVSLQTDNEASQNIIVNGSSNRTIYHDHTQNVMLAKPGQKITVSTYGNTASWLNAYIYLDYNQDGQFKSNIASNGGAANGSELVSFGYHNGKNSTGATTSQSAAGISLPAFTLPENMPTGVYRMRLKLDRNDINPAGSETINTLGGQIVDFLLNVHADADELDIQTDKGTIVKSEKKGLEETIPFKTEIRLYPTAPCSGYTLDRVVVRHGQNINGAQYLHGNKQWEEYEYDNPQIYSDIIIPAEKVDGKLRVSAYFSASPEAEYKLKFEDNFNGTDGDLPDSRVWTPCSRENATWKRFTAQTAEGQRRTGFIRNGKLVMRCIPNDIAEEGEVEMISGAVESSHKLHFTYGRVEGRLLTYPYKGNFPAFWLLPEDDSAGWPTSGEIDIWEQIDTEQTTYHTVHTHWTYDLHMDLLSHQGKGKNIPPQDYHVFALQWTPTVLTWYLDDKQVFSYSKSSSSSALNKGQWPFDKDFYIVLNQSVGNGSWAKPADTSHEYETKFDYVRVYQKDDQNINSGVASLNTSNRTLDVYSREGALLLVASEAQPVAIHDVMGRCVYSQIVDGNTTVTLPKGLYIVNGKKHIVI